MDSVRATGGVLLTGGRSTRMGRDKASLKINGVTLAIRTGRLLTAAVSIAIEVGSGQSELEAVREDPAGGGPLVALVAGTVALRSRGHFGAVLVVACDLPLLDASILDRLVTYPGARSVVPLVGGLAQPICARYRADDLDAAAALVAAGERSMRALLGVIDADYLHLDDDPRAAAMLADADTPQDLHAIGLEPEPPDGADTLG